LRCQTVRDGARRCETVTTIEPIRAPRHCGGRSPTHPLAGDVVLRVYFVNMSNPVPGIGVNEVFELLRGGAPLVDVREPHEYDEVRAVGARLVPLQSVPQALATFPVDGPVYVICRSGARSHKACEWLRQQGVDAVNVLGGTLAWVDATLPTEAGPAAPQSIASGDA
jgi:rhodanese-related sulfurtransferase